MKKQVISKSGVYIDWDKKKVISKGLAKGTYYAAYFKDGKFFFWVTRKEIKRHIENKDFD